MGEKNQLSLLLKRPPVDGTTGLQVQLQPRRLDLPPGTAWHTWSLAYNCGLQLRVQEAQARAGVPVQRRQQLDLRSHCRWWRALQDCLRRQLQEAATG